MGAPAGNQNARKRHWSTAIEAAVMVEDERTKKRRLHAIADKLISMAEGGDIQAMKEIGDRLDGKAAQDLNLGSNPENPMLLLMGQMGKSPLPVAPDDGD